MPTPMQIIGGHVKLNGDFTDTLSAKIIAELLFIATVLTIWEDECYFPKKCRLHNLRKMRQPDRPFLLIQLGWAISLLEKH